MHFTASNNLYIDQLVTSSFFMYQGNLAYSNGDLAKAEDCYTQGLNSVSQYENSTSCLRALMVCYGKHGATGMSLGRTKKALEDCLMAATIDPNFLKVQVRAAQ
ncbi:putative tetratricopeptide-like helical domain superfamily [Helianthus annuus]|nr:putative tetratricopeptide-like helical domain superfamily [Helianthus annuus]